MNNITFKVFIIGFFSLLLLKTAFAQTFNLQSIPTNKSNFSLRFIHPKMKTITDLSTFSGVYEFSLNIPVSSKLNFVSSIPYITANYELDYGFFKHKFDEGGAGNIFIGLQTNKEEINEKKSIVSFGLFLPSADENISLFGVYSDYCNFGKYFPNVLTLYFNYAYHNLKPNGFRFGIEVSPNILIPTKDTGMESELYLRYGISTGYKAQQFLFNLELLGIAIISEDIETFEDRFVHSLNFGSAWIVDNIVPKIFYKIYLKDEISEIIDGVLGIGISISTK